MLAWNGAPIIQLLWIYRLQDRNLLVSGAVKLGGILETEAKC